jgi:hypothetical protein
MYLHNQQPRLGETRKWVHRTRRDPANGPAPTGIAGFGEPGVPVFDFPSPCAQCTLPTHAQCRAVLRDAILEAIRLANNAADRIDDVLQVPANGRNAQATETARLFRSFFGHDPLWPVPWAGNEASGISVAKRFRAVAKELGGGRRITFLCRVTRAGCGEDLTCCDPCDNGWFSTALPNTVNLCAPFWRPRAGLRGLPHRNYRAAIIIHEMLHMLFEDVRDARRGRPRAACYEAFALRVARYGADPFDVCNCTGTPCPPDPVCPV